MENSTVKIVLASAVVSFALGFGTAWYMQSPDAQPPVTVADAPPLSVTHDPVSGQGRAAWTLPAQQSAPLSTLPANASVDQLWTRALLPADGYDAEDRLRKLAQSDPVALRSLLNRYSASQAPQERELLKSLLSTIPTAEVIAFSTRLAASSSPAERKYGFEMLQSVAPDSAETRSLVKRTLQTEQSPEVLVQALGTLQSAAAEPEDAELMVAQLQTLAQHADPAVRSLAIQKLGHWDKKGEGAEQLSQALSDRAPEVRQAAIFAISQANVRSDGVKATLMAMVNNAQESRDVRGSALQALERFSLSKEEYASVAQARSQLRGF